MTCNCARDAHEWTYTFAYEYLNAETMIALHERGVPSDVIVAMLTRNRELQSHARNGPAQQRTIDPTNPATDPQAAWAYPPVPPAIYAPEPAYSETSDSAYVY